MSGSDAMLSPHFSFEEGVVTLSGLANHPDEAAIAEMQRTADLLEEIRELLACPLRITSFYRSPKVNAFACGGVDRPSAHKWGRAADFQPTRMAVGTAFDLIRHCPEIMARVDQLIFEAQHGAQWIHVSIPALGRHPRQEARIGRLVQGIWKYPLVQPIEKWEHVEEHIGGRHG